MPRKFTMVDKKEWLEKLENGKSEASIAKDRKCDLRTIRRGIEDARRARDAQSARIDLLKQAVLKHHDTLLQKLEGISLGLSMPPHDWTPIAWNQSGASILMQSDLDTQDSPDDEASEDLKDSDLHFDMVEGMLKQHLRNDKLWKLLAQRERAYASYQSARIALQRKVVKLLEEETGYSLEPHGAAPPPFLFSSTVGDLCYRTALGGAFGEYKNDAWQDEIVVDPSGGRVEYCGAVLAQVPGKAEECRGKLLEVFQEVQVLAEVTRAVNTYESLEASTLRARKAIEEIKQLGLVPGVCSVCRRLGM